MIYGEEKYREMSRSVLPSTRAKGARDDRRNIHKSVRAKVRNALSKFVYDEDYEDFDHDHLWIDPQKGPVGGGGWNTCIKDMVRERRYGDKVAPLQRWAEAKADDFGDTPAERWIKLRSMLPPGLMGDHVMTHIENIEAFDPEPRWWRNRGPSWNEQRRAEKAERQAKFAVLVAEARARAERQRNFVHHFNRWIREHFAPSGGHESKRFKGYKRGLNGEETVIPEWETYYTYCNFCTETPRVLRRFSDMGAFMEYAFKVKKAHPLYYDALRAFKLIDPETKSEDE